MAQDVTQYNQPLPPAPARSRQRIEQGQSLRDRFVQGISMPYPILSIRGKEFALKHNGLEHVLPSKDIDVILVNSSDKMNKAFYIKGYDGGNDQPDCFSFDALKPDASAPHIQNPTCISCKWNLFGSAQSQDGTARKGKACSDSRKLVLVFPNDLVGNDLGPMMLRVPVTSHQNMKAYLDYIYNQGFDPNACVTTLRFARDAEGKALSYPKLEFIFNRPLTDDEYDLADALVDDERTQRILQAPPEGDTASADGVSQAQPVYNAALGTRPRPVIHTERAQPAVQPRPQPTPEPRPEPKPEPPPIAAKASGIAGGIVNVGGRRFNLDTQKWVDNEVEEKEQAEPEQSQGWTPPADAPSYSPEVTRGVTGPRTRGRRSTPPQTIEASANPEPEPEPEPQPNGSARAAPKDLDSILEKMMPKR